MEESSDEESSDDEDDTPAPAQVSMNLHLVAFLCSIRSFLTILARQKVSRYNEASMCNFTSGCKCALVGQ